MSTNNLLIGIIQIDSTMAGSHVKSPSFLYQLSFFPWHKTNGFDGSSSKDC
jgi:hypothetical protein